MNKYINISETWGDAVETTLEDYTKQANIFGLSVSFIEKPDDGIYCDDELVAIPAPNGAIGGRIQPYFTTHHPTSSYGQPVWICDGMAYGPTDKLPSGQTAAEVVDFFRNSYDGEQGQMAGKFLLLTTRSL